MDSVICEPKEQLVFVNVMKNGMKKTEDYKAIITIHNNNEREVVGYKIKTTSPKKYCVRPSYGKILPGKMKEICVTVRAQGDTKLDSKFNDKFKIQTTFIPESFYDLTTEVYSKKISALFSELESLEKENPESVALKLKQQKLVCCFNGEEGQSTKDNEGEVYDDNQEDTKPEKSREVPEINNIHTTTTTSSPREVNTASALNSPMTSSDNTEKIPSNIVEANLMIKELESAIQKYSVESLKNDLLEKHRYEKESITELTNDGKKEILDPKELFFEWNTKPKKYILNRTCQWQIAFIIVFISFILGAYIF